MKLSMDQYNALMTEAADKMFELQNRNAELLARASQDAETIKALEQQIATKDAALDECEAYFDSRSDVSDGDYGIPESNEEMRMHSTVLAALAGSAS